MLLYPAADSEPAPLLELLPADSKDQASGFRVRRGPQDDLLILAPGPGPRRFGSRNDGCATDAEMAYVRRLDGQVIEAGMAGGRRLEIAGKALIEVGPGIM